MTLVLVLRNQQHDKQRQKHSDGGSEAHPAQDVHRVTCRTVSPTTSAMPSVVRSAMACSRPVASGTRALRLCSAWLNRATEYIARRPTQATVSTRRVCVTATSPIRASSTSVRACSWPMVREAKRLRSAPPVPGCIKMLWAMPSPFIRADHFGSSRTRLAQPSGQIVGEFWSGTVAAKTTRKPPAKSRRKQPDEDTPSSTKRTTIDIDGLARELSQVVRKGLPASERTAASVLPNLRNVVARAVHPDDAASRVAALNDVLPKMVGQLSDDTYREAATILFGLAPGTRGTALMARRRQAATLVGMSAEHFRKAGEPEMLTAVAELLYRDLLRYKSRVKRSVASLEPTGDTPKLEIDDLTAEEELISRIWASVYLLRAETIAHLRLVREPRYEGQAEDHRQASARVHEELRALIAEYVRTYGPLIRHGEAEFATEALERLAGWRH